MLNHVIRTVQKKTTHTHTKTEGKLDSRETKIMTARKWILKSHFAGFPKREDLEIVEETLPALGDEGIGLLSDGIL